MTQPRPSAGEIRALNDSIRYAMWSVFAATSPLGDDAGTREGVQRELEDFLAGVEADRVVVRGLYDVSGLRADADLMIWWHAETIEALQAAYQGFRRTRLGRHLDPVWSVAALHRPAEFNKGHVPAFMKGEEPRAYLAVYPFVRSYDWYVIGEDDRRAMLAEHGQMARDYPDVRANTIASFALNDYEWILAFEADDLHRIVDLMRHLRGAKARLHVREEIPFFTGPRRSAGEIVAALP